MIQEDNMKIYKIAEGLGWMDGMPDNILPGQGVRRDPFMNVDYRGFKTKEEEQAENKRLDQWLKDKLANDPEFLAWAAKEEEKERLRNQPQASPQQVQQPTPQQPKV